MLYEYRQLHCHVKTEDIYKDVAEDVEARCDTSNFELGRALPKEKNKKVIRLMKDELGGQIMKEFVGSRAKTYSSLKWNNDEDKKKQKVQKSVSRKEKLNFKI